MIKLEIISPAIKKKRQQHQKLADRVEGKRKKTLRQSVREQSENKQCVDQIKWIEEIIKFTHHFARAVFFFFFFFVNFIQLIVAHS